MSAKGATLEMLCSSYRQARDQLNDEGRCLLAELETVKQSRMPMLKAAVLQASSIESELRDAVLAADKSLFGKNKTILMHGVKVGWNKQKGKVVIKDEAKTIKLIKDRLPAKQVELLIRKTERVHRPSVYDLVASDLKRLAIEIVDDGEIIVVKDVHREIDKLIGALLLAAGADSAEGD